MSVSDVKFTFMLFIYQAPRRQFYVFLSPMFYLGLSDYIAHGNNCVFSIFLLILQRHNWVNT